MFQTLLRKKVGLVLAVGLFLGSTPALGDGEKKPFTTIQTAGLWTLIAATIRLGMKEEPAKDPVTVEKLPATVHDIAKELEEGNVINALRLCAKIADDLVIGFAGKPSGLKAFTTSVTAEGDDAAKNVMHNGQEVKLIMKESVPAYGLLGSAWSPFKGVIDKLEVLNKFYKLFNDNGNLLTRLLAEAAA